jgi:hypothetical protein
VFLAASPKSPLKSILERPVICLIFSPSATDAPFTHLEGEWELLVPTFSTFKLCIEGSGKLVESWRNRLGLKDGLEQEQQYEVLKVIVQSMTAVN